MSSVSSRGTFPSCGRSILGVVSDDIYQWSGGRMGEDQIGIALAAHGDIGFLLWGDVMLWYFVFVFLYMGALELLFSILEKIR